MIDNIFQWIKFRVIWVYASLIVLLSAEILFATVQIESQITGWSTTLTNIGWGLSLTLIILAGIIYGIAQTMPSENRGKWISIAVGLLLGGVIMAAIIGAAGLIRQAAYESLQPVGGMDEVPLAE